MCGIAGFYLLDPEGIDKDKLLDLLLDEIEHRGGDATGFVALGDDGIMEWQKAACGASEFQAYRRPVPTGTRIVLAHTRWATQGLPAFMENNHPIRRGPFFVIHNGHVVNDDELFQKAGRKRFGQVDSEAIAAMLAKKDSLDHVNDVMKEIDGDAAIAVIDEREPTALGLSRGRGSPLFVLATKRVVLFGSTAGCVLSAHRKTIGSIANTRAQEADEGTTVLIRDGKFHITKFKPKKRKYTYTPSKKSWKWWGSTPATSSSVKDDIIVGWDDDLVPIPKGRYSDDNFRDYYLKCAGCGDWSPHEELEDLFIDGATEKFCLGCWYEWADLLGEEVKLADTGTVNDYVVSNFLREEDDDD